MAQELTVWDKVLKASLSLPGVRVDYQEFLQKELRPYFSQKEFTEFLEGESILPKKIRDRIANGCISYHLTIACGLSAVAGIPGGWGMLATVPADLAQFYAQIFILTQKMLYLYGWEDLRDSEGKLTDEAAQILTIWIAVMMGSATAINALNVALKGFANQAIKRIPKIAFGHSASYLLIKEMGRWIGNELTKKKVAQVASKAVPLIGAPIGAGVTYFTFKPMAKKLKRHLDQSISLLTNS